MTLDNLEQTYLLFGIFAGILVFASSVGFILKKKAGNASSPVIDNLNARINAWWVMLIVIGSAILMGNVAFIILFVALSISGIKKDYESYFL